VQEEENRARNIFKIENFVLACVLFLKKEIWDTRNMIGLGYVCATAKNQTN
jgi:hypothetical protein